MPLPARPPAGKNESAVEIIMNNRKNTIILVVIILAAVAYFSAIFNRGMDVIDEGWFIHKAQMIIDGLVPYRDHFAVVNPGSLYLQAAILHLSGGMVISLRIFALLEAIAVILVAYGITRSFLKPPYSYIAPVILIPWNLFVFYRSANYSVDCTLVAMLCLLAIIEFEKRGSRLWLAAAAACAGLAFIIKQNVGGVVIIFTLFAILFIPDPEGRAYGLKTRIFRIFWAGALTCIPLLAFVIYFFMEDALPEFFRLTVMRSLMAKKTWILGQLTNSILFVILPLSAYTLSVGCFFHFIRKWLDAGKRGKAWVAISLIVLAHVAAATAVIYRLGLVFEWTVFTGVVPLIAFGLAILHLIGDAALQGHERMSMKLTLAFTILLYAVNMMTGMSFAHTIIAFSVSVLVFGYVMEVLVRKWSAVLPRLGPAFLWASIALAGLMGFIPALTNKPIMFFGQQPIVGSTEPVDLPEMKGMRVTAELKQEMESIYAVTEKYTAPGEAILVFPLGSFYYYITDRPAPYFLECFFYQYFFAEEQDEAIESIKSKKVRLVFLPVRGKGVDQQMEALYLRKIFAYIYDNFRAGPVCGRYQAFFRKDA